MAPKEGILRLSPLLSLSPRDSAPRMQSLLLFYSLSLYTFVCRFHWVPGRKIAGIWSPAMVKLMEFFLRGPAEAGEDERLLKDPPGSSDKEGELRSVLDGLSFPISVPHKLVCIFSFSIFLSFCCMEMFIYVGFAPGSESVVSRFLSWILFMGSLY